MQQSIILTICVLILKIGSFVSTRTDFFRSVHTLTFRPTNSAAITTMFPLRLCGGKLLVAVTRERRYGPSRLRVNDNDDD